jgi:hypothetical protein
VLKILGVMLERDGVLVHVLKVCEGLGFDGFADAGE